MNKYIGFLMFFSSIHNSVTQELDEAPLIKVKQGIVTGLKEVSENGKIFHSYYGIPYAEPPVNGLRFKDSLPKSSWKGYLDGTKVPQGCPFNSPSDLILMTKSENLTTYGSEDCLTLNVFTPESNSSITELPVMVYIHGGGFNSGSSYEFPPFVLMDEEIVLVVIQYRLGILGFLSTEDKILPGNMGLKDQQLALKWVNENIECFGGDPNRVTIFGESAGAVSVHLHTFSPGSKGLFERVIMQSGTAICPWSYYNSHLKSAKAVGNYFNCNMERGTEKFLECLQSIDFRDLITYASSTMTLGQAPMEFIPRVDGVFLPDKPEVLLKNGDYTKVDVISGRTRDEGGYIILGLSGNPSTLEKLNSNFKEFGPISLSLEDEKNPVDLASQIYKFYTNKTNNFTEDDFESLEKIYTDYYFTLCGYITEKFLSKDPDVNIFLYQLDHFGSLSDGVNVPGYDRRNWIIHADDLYYFWGGRGPRFNTPLTDRSDIKVRKLFVSAWTNFAKYGNPNINALPCNCSWERSTRSNFKYLSIKEFPETKELRFPEVKSFWSRLKTVQNEIFLET